MSFQTIKVRYEENICFLQLYRPEANNTINALLIQECIQVLNDCEENIGIIVFEGLPDVFCFGADFQGMHDQVSIGAVVESRPDVLYELWTRIATGPFITICHARGKTNAGGIGFLSACDIVIAERKATFSLSELLFGIYPACVLPFLIRRIGFQKANYLTLMTKPISTDEAFFCHLVDVVDDNSEQALKKHLLRLRRLSKASVIRYKIYMNQLNNIIHDAKDVAIKNNQEMHHIPGVTDGIIRFVKTGALPWES